MSTPRKRNFIPAGPITAGMASNHNKAPQPLVGDDAAKRATIGLEYMTYEQLEEFGREMDALRQRVLDDLGQADADYIRKVIKVQRGCEVAGRLGMYVPFLPPVWLAAVGSLGVAKILENMEIGHNIMHGQYDWMNDPDIQGQEWEWDNVAVAEDWRRTHNVEHHTYTNIHGKDKDIGYGLVRIDADQPWRPYYLGNLVYTFWLMALFEWGVMLHGTEWEEIVERREPSELGKQARRRARKKAGKQILKDYLLFPALTGPFFPLTVAGNFAANLMRNVWAFNIIFCGHFPAEVQSFHADDAENETRGQWYLRQLLGSANISGGKLFHVMSGNLSHQIEHHLFPDVPARRYPEMSKEVQALCEKYGLPYNTGRMSKQLWSVFRQLARLSLPTKAEADVSDITAKGNTDSDKVAA